MGRCLTERGVFLFPVLDRGVFNSYPCPLAARAKGTSAEEGLSLNYASMRLARTTMGWNRRSYQGVLGLW